MELITLIFIFLFCVSIFFIYGLINFIKHYKRTPKPSNMKFKVNPLSFLKSFFDYDSFSEGTFKHQLKIFLVIVILLSLGYIFNKNFSFDDDYDPPNKLERLETELYEVRTKLDEMKYCIDDLSSEVDGFYYLNWRVVVPGVISATNDLKALYEDLETEVSDMEYEFN